MGYKHFYTTYQRFEVGSYSGYMSPTFYDMFNASIIDDYELVGFKEHTSVGTPGFHSVKRRHLPINPYHSYSLSISCGSGELFSQDQFGYAQYYRLSGISIAQFVMGSVLSATYLRGGWVDRLNDHSSEEKALAKLIERIQGEKVNLAQMYAERKQVVDMVHSTIDRLVTAFAAIKHGKPNLAFQALGMKTRPRKEVLAAYHKARARDPLDAAGNLWLELQYGWKPLLGDVYSAAELLASRVVDRQPVLKAKSSSEQKVQNLLQGSFFGMQTGLASVSAKYSTRYYVEYEIPSESALLAGKTGLTNPALLAWELLPYSFVVDWFLPIGPWLESFTAFDGLEFKRGYRQNLSELKCGVSGAREIKELSPYFEARVNFQTQMNEREYTRTVLYSFPTPSLPRVKNPFSFSHVNSAVALLQNTFRKSVSKK